MFPYSQLHEPIGYKALPLYAQKDDLMDDYQLFN